jgi:hypothetical protein
VDLSFIKIPPFPFNKATCTGLGISRADLDRADHLFLLAPFYGLWILGSWGWFPMGNPGSEETEEKTYFIGFEMFFLG